MAKKRKENFLSSNYGIALFVVLAFIIGYLFARVQMLEKTNSSSYPTTVTLTPRVQETPLTEIAKKVGVDIEKFKSCLSSNRYRDKVQSQFKEGSQAGIRGTPGNVLYDMKTDRTKLVNGAVPYTVLKQALEDLRQGRKGEDEVEIKIKKPVYGKDHWRGSKNARFVLVEYSDFECPFCKRFHPTAQQLLDEYKGEIAWVYRHFPLTSLHAKAQKAAEASECVYEQRGDSAFWKFADLLFDAMPNVDVNS